MPLPRSAATSENYGSLSAAQLASTVSAARLTVNSTRLKELAKIVHSFLHLFQHVCQHVNCAKEVPLHIIFQQPHTRAFINAFLARPLEEAHDTLIH